MITGRITSLAMHTRTVLHDPAVRWSLHRFVLVAQVWCGALFEMQSELVSSFSYHWHSVLVVILC
jgi:hypothetical protein